ncbi:MAG: hypothetical protein M3186_17605 [Actinomycetota bacterium]|nr:hypothetical protein [Actinomycetota bacterium]
MEAYDLTGGLRAGPRWPVAITRRWAHYVALRDAGLAPGERVRCGQLIDEFPDKVEE